MQNAVLVGLSRQLALAREMDVIANNIANMNTDGFKADGALFEEYLNSAARGMPDARVSFVRDRATWIDMSSGPIERTGNALDVAINGDGFFAVQTPRGVRYTRNGSFHINANGQLVTAAGDPVLGDGGPITFQPTDRQISINPDGTVSVREGASITDSQRGRLRIVTVDNPALLQKDGNTYFNYVGNAQPADARNVTVEQGAIEKSNVRAVVEMARMIEVTRSYTQIAAMLQQQSDLSQSAVDKLAEVPT
jgi:flagellar basal-body rod protein FlgF